MTDLTSPSPATGSLWPHPSPSAQRSDLGMTVRDRVVRELRHRILLGSLPAGERIDLDALAAEFGTSRTPIREATLELAIDNLVRVAPRSGVTVLGITARDLLDNFELMATLAGMASFWAAERATPDDLERIRHWRDAVASASEVDGDVAAANFEFHRCINQASHSARVMALIARTARLFPERFSEVAPDQVPCSLVEHADLVSALERGDASTARSLMESHFQQAAERLRRHLGTDG